MVLDLDYNHDDGYSPFAAYTALHRHASVDLQRLSWLMLNIGPLRKPSSPLPPLQLVNQFTSLTHLWLEAVYIGEWPTEPLFTSTHLVVLHIGVSCLYIDPEDRDSTPEFSLTIFNHYQKLEILRLVVSDLRSFGSIPIPFQFVLSGDLYLPALQELCLCCSEGHAMLSELSFKHISLDCCVNIDNMDIMQDAAKSRIVTSGNFDYL